MMRVWSISITDQFVDKVSEFTTANLPTKTAL